MRYDLLQPLVLRLQPFENHPLAQYWTCSFPARWAAQLRQDVFRPGFGDGLDDEKIQGIPLWAVNNAIAALMPQVLTHDARARRDAVWLAWSDAAGGKPPQRELLVEFVKGGLVAAVQYRNAKAARRRGHKPIDIAALARVVEGFQGEELQFHRHTLRLGSGAAPMGADFTLVPHALAGAPVHDPLAGPAR